MPDPLKVRVADSSGKSECLFHLELDPIEVHRTTHDRGDILDRAWRIRLVPPSRKAQVVTEFKQVKHYFEKGASARDVIQR